MCKPNKYGLSCCLNYEAMYMQKWYVIIFLKILTSKKTFSMCKFVPINQITRMSQYPSELSLQHNLYTSGCPNSKNKLHVIYERVFRQWLQNKTLMVQWTVAFMLYICITMCIIRAIWHTLVVLIMNIHVRKYFTFYCS